MRYGAGFDENQAQDNILEGEALRVASDAKEYACFSYTVYSLPSRIWNGGTCWLWVKAFK